MRYTQKIMRLDLSAERPDNSGYYYAEILLPAEEYEIRDATIKTGNTKQKQDDGGYKIDTGKLFEENIRL